VGSDVRGILIQKFLAVIRRLDTTATAAVATGGYDDVFGDTLPTEDGSQFGGDSRREHAALSVPCQVDRRGWGMDQLYRSGHQENTTVVLTLHMPDLENQGLLDADGNPIIRPGDRIEKITDIAGNLQVAFPEADGGMYIETVEQAGHGLNYGGIARFNLVILSCKPERQGGAG